MNTYSTVAAVLGAQPRSDADRPTIFDWIKRKLLERQQRIAQERLIAELRSLDRHLLDDLDIDPELLAYDASVAMSRHNPHIIAACMFAQGLRRVGR